LGRKSPPLRRFGELRLDGIDLPVNLVDLLLTPRYTAEVIDSDGDARLACKEAGDLAANPSGGAANLGHGEQDCSVLWRGGSPPVSCHSRMGAENLQGARQVDEVRDIVGDDYLRADNIVYGDSMFPSQLLLAT